MVEPSGMKRGLEDVLILTEGVHQRIPETPSGTQPVYIAPAPPGGESAAPAESALPASKGTEADRLRTQYKALGEEQNHKYGDNPPGTKPVDFTKLGNPNAPPAQAPPPAKNPPSPAGTSAPTAGKPAVPPVAAPPKPDAKKNSPTLPAAPVATPPAAPPAAPPKKSPTVGPLPAPAKQSPPPPGGTPAKNPPDAVRRVNQSAGAPPGGQPR
jgi:hypothetical protein